MVITLIIVGFAFCWLLWETEYLTVDLMGRRELAIEGLQTLIYIAPLLIFWGFIAKKEVFKEMLEICEKGKGQQPSGASSSGATDKKGDKTAGGG